MSDALDARIADAERRLRFAESSQRRLASSEDLDRLNASKLAEVQHETDEANNRRLADLGINPPFA